MGSQKGCRCCTGFLGHFRGYIETLIFYRTDEGAPSPPHTRVCSTPPPGGTPGTKREQGSPLPLRNRTKHGHMRTDGEHHSTRR